MSTVTASSSALQSDPIIVTHCLAQRVTTHAGALDILHPIDLIIQRGEKVAIVGASGSGKTTLLGLLAGLDQPSSGRVMLAGQHLGALNEEARARLRGQQVGFVFQNFQLLPALTALENVMLPLELQHIDQALPRAQAVLAQVGLAERARHYPRQLSGGEQQRVAIARAFVTEPPILFADEPTGNLDTTTGEAIAQLMFDLNTQHNTTLVLVTHDEALAARCDRCLRMQAGRLSEAVS